MTPSQSVRVKPSLTPMHRGRLPAFSCRHLVDGLERTSGRNAYPSGIHPIDHHVADPEPTRIADQSKAGRPRAHNPPIERANAPPKTHAPP